MRSKIKKPGVYPKAKWAAYIRSWMTKEGLSPLAAAARLHITHSAIHNWIMGHTRPPATALYRMAPLMGVSVEELQVNASRSIDMVTVPLQEIADLIKVPVERLAAFISTERRGEAA